MQGVKLFICPIPAKCSEAQVTKLFVSFGEVWDFKVSEMSPFNRKASFRMKEECARVAIRDLHLKRVLDPFMPLTVEYAPIERAEPLSADNKSPTVKSVTSDQQTVASLSDESHPCRRAGAWIELFTGGASYYYNEDLRVAQWNPPAEFMERFPNTVSCVDEYFDKLRPEKSRKRVRSPLSTTTSTSRHSSPMAHDIFRPSVPRMFSSPPVRPPLSLNHDRHNSRIPSVRPVFQEARPARMPTRTLPHDPSIVRPHFRPSQPSMQARPASNPRPQPDQRQEQGGLLSPPPLVSPSSPAHFSSPPPLSPRAPPLTRTTGSPRDVWSPPGSPRGPLDMTPSSPLPRPLQARIYELSKYKSRSRVVPY